MSDTLEKVREIINADILDDQENVHLFNCVRAALEPFEGKPITKRLATAVEKALPGLRVTYRPVHGIFNVILWGGAVGGSGKWDDKGNFLLGYEVGGNNPQTNHGTFTLAGFDYQNRWAGEAALERIQKNETDLANAPAIAKAIDNYRQADAALKAAIGDSSYDHPSNTALERLANGEVD